MQDAPLAYPTSDQARFGRRLAEPRGARMPVIVVTGFLGAGKSTLIKQFLSAPEGRNTAVIVNEFGEIGIDQALLRTGAEATVLLGNGCLCCSMRSDLEVTLRELLADAATGRIPSFERVVVETSGLADPGPILQTFAADRGIGREFHVDTVIALVDAASAQTTLANEPEARHQVVMADRILITKTDLVAEPPDRLRATLAALNPNAEIAIVAHGDAGPDVWRSAPFARPPVHYHKAAHSDGVTSFPLFFDKPVPWPAFAQAVETLIALRGPDVLRIKGLIAVEGTKGPVVIHVVRHVFHPPAELAAWPDEDHRSRLVVITRNLPRAQVKAVFDAVLGL